MSTEHDTTAAPPPDGELPGPGTSDGAGGFTAAATTTTLPVADDEAVVRRGHHAGSRKPRGGKLGVGGIISAVWLTLVFVSAVLAPWLPLKDPSSVDFANLNQLPNQPIGTHGFILGTDQNSFDIFSRLIWGGRVSLIVALGVLVIGLVVGGTIGIIAGYFRGRTETVLMSIVDMLLAFPALVLLIAIVAFLGANLTNVVLGHLGGLDPRLRPHGPGHDADLLPDGSSSSPPAPRAPTTGASSSVRSCPTSSSRCSPSASSWWRSPSWPRVASPSSGSPPPRPSPGAA